MDNELHPYDFGLRLREAREAKGWNQKQVSQILKIHPNSVGYWENNSREPQLHKFRELMDLYDADPKYILGLDHKEFVSITGLSARQKEMVRALIQSLQEENEEPK